MEIGQAKTFGLTDWADEANWNFIGWWGGVNEIDLSWTKLLGPIGIHVLFAQPHLTSCTIDFTCTHSDSPAFARTGLNSIELTLATEASFDCAVLVWISFNDLTLTCIWTASWPHWTPLVLAYNAVRFDSLVLPYRLVLISGWSAQEAPGSSWSLGRISPKSSCNGKAKEATASKHYKMSRHSLQVVCTSVWQQAFRITRSHHQANKRPNIWQRAYSKGMGWHWPLPVAAPTKQKKNIWQKACSRGMKLGPFTSNSPNNRQQIARSKGFWWRWTPTSRSAGKRFTIW